MAMTYRKPMTRIVMLKTGSVLSKTKSYRKKLHHRPAAFIQKMYASLQGRYREHILQHDLPDRMLQKCFSVKKGKIVVTEKKRKQNTFIPQKLLYTFSKSKSEYYGH